MPGEIEEQENGSVALDLLDGPADDAAPSDAPEGEGAGPVKADTQPAPFDAAKFAADLGASIGSTLKPTAPEKKEPELTPEEARKLLNVWEPDDTFLAEIGNPETQKSAWIKARDALVRQIDTIAQFRLRDQRAELERLYEEKYGPILTQFQQQQEAQQTERLHKAHPGLANPVVQPLLAAVTKQLISEKKTFKDETSLFTELASRVEAVGKQFNPEFTLAGATAPAKPPKRVTGAIPVTSPGAGGGGGQAPAAGATGKPKALSLL